MRITVEHFEDRSDPDTGGAIEYEYVYDGVTFAEGDRRVSFTRYRDEPTVAYPGEPGRYRYMPYRGHGHYDLMQALARATARCSYIGARGTVEFDVAAVPEYGVLQIDVVHAAFAAPTT